jgi:hypothetical protein
MRLATIVLCLIGAAIWLFFAYATLLSGSDPATRGLDLAAGILMTFLFGLTIVPAAILFGTRRAPRVALGLALAFPLILILLSIAAILAF